MADELLQFLGLEDKPILTRFIEEIANKGLQQYQRVIQWGEHHGQSLYNHIVSGVFLIHTLQEVLQLNEEGLTEEELKTLTIAFCIHDLNKTYEGRETSYSRIATPENIAKEIEKIGFDGFFSNWREYIEDITILARRHSGHNSVDGESLDKSSDPTRLGKSCLKELSKIIRAVDVADLSHSYSEHKHKQTFLSHFNSFSQKQYRLIAHQVSEQRGLLTNIIHNEVVKFLREKFNASPIFLYAQGTHYLAPTGTDLTLNKDDYFVLGKLVGDTILKMKSEEYGKFIENGNQGIKIKKELLELGVQYSEIFGYINTLIQRKNFNLSSKEDDCRRKLRKRIDKGNDSETNSIQVYLESARILPIDQEIMRLGELLRTLYIFLGDYCKKSITSKVKGCRDPWLYICQVLSIQDYEKYEVLDARYDRAYVLAESISINYEELLELVIEQANLLAPLERIEKPTIPDYVKNNISFDFQKKSLEDFSLNLKQYCLTNHKQSCYASSVSETVKWESGYVPKGIKVDQFSNRLEGGSYPKRNVDPIVQQQFLIERLNYSFSGDNFLYLHLMPYSFMTAPFIESFKLIAERLRRTDISAVSISVKKAIQFFDEELYILLPIEYEKT